MDVPHQCRSSPAFTLIEMSVVLIIIGLIIGSVLVGRDLVSAAAINAQIAQINKYNSAVNAFKDKYDGLPGDLKASQVSVFGFQTVPTRAGTAAQGDGDGLIEGYNYTAGFLQNGCVASEMAWFWEDLSSNSGLIEGAFNTATNAGYAAGITIDSVVPTAKLGKGNYVYVYSVNSLNYFSVSSVSFGGAGCLFSSGASPGLTVQQAYSLDKKIDDGYPQTGSVLAMYVNWSAGQLVTGQSTALAYPAVWAGGNTSAWNITAGAGVGTAASQSSTTCYDNGGNASNPMQYSLNTSGGRNNNCALSFQFP